MLFGTKKIDHNEFNSAYRPLLVEIAKDCMKKAKSMYSKSVYKQIEDPKYVAKDSDMDFDEDNKGELKTYVFEDNYSDIIIAVIDGTQDARCTSAAGKFLDEIKSYLENKYKSKLVNKKGNKMITISTGDGDEGCVYIRFDQKFLGFKTRDINYKPLKISESSLVSRLDNLKFI